MVETWYLELQQEDLVTPYYFNFTAEEAQDFTQYLDWLEEEFEIFTLVFREVEKQAPTGFERAVKCIEYDFDLELQDEYKPFQLTKETK